MTSPVTRTKILSILSQFARINLIPILQFLPKLSAMVAEEHWELKGQLLILCSNALYYLDINAPNEDEDQEQPSQQQVEGEAGNSLGESGLNQSSKDESGSRDKMVTHELIGKVKGVLFDIINKVLTPNAPKTTIKIGLNYLA